MEFVQILKNVTVMLDTQVQTVDFQLVLVFLQTKKRFVVIMENVLLLTYAIVKTG
jgi:hypothetical protein